MDYAALRCVTDYRVHVPHVLAAVEVALVHVQRGAAGDADISGDSQASFGTGSNDTWTSTGIGK